MHRLDLIDWADNYFLSGPGSFAKRKTFGCPSYYLGKKMAAFVNEDELVIKLPKERVAELVELDSEVYGIFSPMGQPMNSWLTITFPEAREYDSILDLIEEGVNFVMMDVKPKIAKKKSR